MYPKFTIREILSNRGRVELLGRLSSTRCSQQPWIDDGWLGYLQHQEYLFYGRWHTYGDLWGFVFEQDDKEVAVQAGEELIAYEGYWGERVELVVNENIDWQKAQFESRDE